jgi:hypothetical protein
MRRVYECYGSLRAEVGLRRFSARRHAGSDHPTEILPACAERDKRLAFVLRVAATNAPRRLVRSCCCARAASGNAAAKKGWPQGFFAKRGTANGFTPLLRGASRNPEQTKMRVLALLTVLPRARRERPRGDLIRAHQ